MGEIRGVLIFNEDIGSPLYTCILLDRVCKRTETDSADGDFLNDTAYLTPAMLKQLLIPTDTGYPKVSAGSDFVAYVTTVFNDSFFSHRSCASPERKRISSYFP